ncbi:hypothetical protein HY623_01515 [Candidatus Uhrbacteria bacterium]|nr:hypothetical protein [Candidatus Uhrbacteria bacterium]
MSSYDLFLLVATLALVFIAAFLCCALYWLIRVLRIWTALSAEFERNVHQGIDRFYQALHALSSFKAVADIGMQTLQAALSVYQRKKTSARSKRALSKESDS